VQGFYVVADSVLVQVGEITSFLVEFVRNPFALSALNPYAENAVVNPFPETLEFDIVLALRADDVVTRFHVELHRNSLLSFYMVLYGVHDTDYILVSNRFPPYLIGQVIKRTVLTRGDTQHRSKTLTIDKEN